GGATCSLITRKGFSVNKQVKQHLKNSIRKLEKPVHIGALFSGSQVNEVVDLDLSWQGKSIQFPAYVVDSDDLSGGCDLIIGHDVIGKNIGLSQQIGKKPNLCFGTSEDQICCDLNYSMGDAKMEVDKCCDNCANQHPKRLQISTPKGRS